MTTFKLQVGQMVPWPASPDGVAQVDDLHRTRVTILYYRHGRLCRARPLAADLAALIRREPLLFTDPPNWFHRAALPRAKTFEVQGG